MQIFPQTVYWDDERDALVIIDQTQLPQRLELLQIDDISSLWDAIRLLKVRGAPAIGVAAAYGAYMSALAADQSSRSRFLAEFKEQNAYLNSSRPTAVNLSWALARMEKVADENADLPLPELIQLLRLEADAIHDEDIRVCRAIGENGLSLLKKGDGILTHCNAGRLAAVELGTATAPIYVGEEQGYNFRVFCDETRPLLQGIRLTAFELASSGVDTTVICEGMGLTVMRKGWVQAVLVGCDRVAANGDTANKIGTAAVSVAAKSCGIPFYVCAPTATIDLACPNGSTIPIEERDAAEVTDMWYASPMGPEGIKVFNPSFDVTLAQDITAIVTEYGIAYPPFDVSLRQIMDRKQQADV